MIRGGFVARCGWWRAWQGRDDRKLVSRADRQWHTVGASGAGAFVLAGSSRVADRHLTMSLPFTTDQFLDVFRQYNTSIWPIQVLLVALAVGAVGVAVGAKAYSGRLVALYVAAQWAWTGVVYHWWFFSRINPAARAFGAVWVVGGLAFAWSAGPGGGRLTFRTAQRWRLAVGGALAIYALIVYPLLGHFGGRAYPSGPTFGAPCPVTILTFALLWLAADPVPRYLLAAPLIWAAVGSLAAFSLGVYEDLGLLVAGMSGVVLLSRPRVPQSEPHAGQSERTRVSRS
jgi:hypothetical protein